MSSAESKGDDKKYIVFIYYEKNKLELIKMETKCLDCNKVFISEKRDLYTWNWMKEHNCVGNHYGKYDNV